MYFTPLGYELYSWNSKLSIETVETYIKTIGLYKTKAKNILLTSKFIEENYGGANGQQLGRQALLQQQQMPSSSDDTYQI